jgi:serine/threonine-protein kinase
LIEPIQREFLVIEERLDAVELSRATNRFGTDDAIKSLLFHLLCALDVIWRRNVVHRDIKPANILITAENEPRIIDLGIARFLDDIALTDSLAAMGPGTLIYAAPEQLRNRRSMINVRTDFYLLGLLILELMHGFHPFDPRHVGTPDSLLDNVFAGRYVAPDEQRDEVLRQFVSTALAVQPYLRFRTVEAVFDHFGLDRDQC